MDFGFLLWRVGDPGAKIIPGDFNGDGKTDFIIYDAHYAALYTATGDLSNPFTWMPLWNPTFDPDGWAAGNPVTITTGDFNGDGRTDFLVQNSDASALFSGTGLLNQPFSEELVRGMPPIH